MIAAPHPGEVGERGPAQSQSSPPLDVYSEENLCDQMAGHLRQRRRSGFAEAVKAHHAANAGRSSGQAMAALLGQYARGIALSAVIAEEHIAPHLDELTADGWQGLAVGLETFAAELRRRIRAVEGSR